MIPSFDGAVPRHSAVDVSSAKSESDMTALSPVSLRVSGVNAFPAFSSFFTTDTLARAMQDLTIADDQ